MCKPSNKPAHGCPMACNALMTYYEAVRELTLMLLHSRFLCAPRTMPVPYVGRTGNF